MRQSLATLLLLLVIITIHTSHSLKVAVIGGGAAGLAAVRVLSRSGVENIVLLEKDGFCGGVWNYNEKEAFLKPMYKNLRTNLPKEIMQFREKPWTNLEKSYVTHRDVLQYLNDYKNEFNLNQYIRYGCQVQHLVVLNQSEGEQHDDDDDWPRIRLTWQQQSESTQHEQTFDAVCVCNGHYSVPSCPSIEGLSSYFRGTKIMHSIEYDDPSQYNGQTVLCIGARASGSDLAREISHYARHVYLSDSTAQSTETNNNVTRVPKTLRVNSDGSFELDGGCTITNIDTVIFCSGYDYSFPFIHEKTSNLELSVKDRRVMPLYKQLWHARHLSLVFLGLPHSVVPFPLFELQAEAVVNQLLKRASGELPPLQERLQEAQRDAVLGGYTQQGRIQDTHYLGSGQWDYCRDMAKLAGLYDDELENYIATNQAIYDCASRERKSLFPGGPDTYRETCYERDDENQSFRVVARAGSSVKTDAAATASSQTSRG